MQTLLIWQRREGTDRDRSDPAAIEESLLETMGSLLEEPPICVRLQNEAAYLVYLQSQTEGHTFPYLQGGRYRSVISLDQPFNASRLLRSRGIAHDESNVLIRLAEALEAEPEGLLRELSPHFTLVDFRLNEPFASIQQDGLGFQQLFIHQKNDFWAISNRLFAFRALGMDLRPEPAHWKVVSCFNGLTLEDSGYKEIEIPQPGERIEIDRSGIRRLSHPVSESWVSQTRLPLENCIERAYTALRQEILDAEPYVTAWRAGLTSGHDSRVVVALLHSMGLPVETRTRGLPDTFDIEIAKQLANNAGLTHIQEPENALPPDSVDSLRSKIDQALLWQGGYMEAKLHKMFLGHRDAMGPRGLNVMGQFGEIAKWRYGGPLREALAGGTPPEAALTVYMLRRASRYLRDDVRAEAEGRFRDSIRTRVSAFDDPETALEYFYLMERVRRLGSAGHYAEPHQILAPFLNVDLIRTAFTVPVESRNNLPLHQGILERTLPEWLDVPYTEKLKRKRKRKLEKAALKARSLSFGRRWLRSVRISGKPRSAPIPWKRPEGETSFNAQRYWRQVGYPLYEEARATGGLWEQIFDADKLSGRHGPKPYDQIVFLARLQEMTGG